MIQPPQHYFIGQVLFSLQTGFAPDNAHGGVIISQTSLNTVVQGTP